MGHHEYDNMDIEIDSLESKIRELEKKVKKIEKEKNIIDFKGSYIETTLFNSEKDNSNIGFNSHAELKTEIKINNESRQTYPSNKIVVSLETSSLINDNKNLTNTKIISNNVLTPKIKDLYYKHNFRSSEFILGLNMNPDQDIERYSLHDRIGLIDVNDPLNLVNNRDNDNKGMGFVYKYRNDSIQTTLNYTSTNEQGVLDMPDFVTAQIGYNLGEIFGLSYQDYTYTETSKQTRAFGVNTFLKLYKIGISIGYQKKTTDDWATSDLAKAIGFNLDIGPGELAIALKNNNSTNIFDLYYKLNLNDKIKIIPIIWKGETDDDTLIAFNAKYSFL
jgi:hypothetical protein